MRKTTCLVVWMTLVMFPVAARAQNEHWQVGTSPSFSSGKYGTDARTEVFHTPITARRLFDAGDLTLVFPFTCIRGNGTVTVVNGSPVRRERADAGAPSTATTPTRSGTTTGTTRTDTGTTRTGATDTSAASTATAAPQLVTNCGLGDIIVRGRYFVFDERGWMPTIALRAHVKTPTANEERGLGTGRPDEGVGLELSRTIGRGFLVMADGGYTIIGEPAGADFNNNWWYDVGVGQNLVRGILNLSLFFEEDSAIVPGLANAKELLAAITVKGANGWRLQVSGALGLSDGAPDHGVTFGASRRF